MCPLTIAFGEVGEILDGFRRLFVEEPADDAAFARLEDGVGSGLACHAFSLKKLSADDAAGAKSRGLFFYFFVREPPPRRRRPRYAFHCRTIVTFSIFTGLNGRSVALSRGMRAIF